jgi:hypothetical protein
MGRLPAWLRLVLTIEVSRRWRLLAAQGHDGVVSGSTALVVWLRHRVCGELVWADGGLLREAERVAGLSVAALDDAVVAVLRTLPSQEAADDLREVERRTPLRLEEALVLVSLRDPDADLERIVAWLPDDGYWTARRPELQGSLRTRGYVERGARTVIPMQRVGVTLGTAGRVWVEPHERDGRAVAGYWRRR